MASNTSKVLQALCPHFRSFNHVILCVSRTMEPVQFRAEQQCLHKRVEWVLRAGKTFMHPSLTCVSGLEVYFKSCQREKYFWRWNSILSTPWSSDWSSEYCNKPIFHFLTTRWSIGKTGSKTQARQNVVSSCSTKVPLHLFLYPKTIRTQKSFQTVW